MNWHPWETLFFAVMGFLLGWSWRPMRIPKPEVPFVTVAMVLAAQKWADANGVPITLAQAKALLDAALGEKVI
jgi:hypothetical protein